VPERSYVIVVCAGAVVEPALHHTTRRILQKTSLMLARGGPAASTAWRYVNQLISLINFPRSEWPQPVTACATGPTLAAQSSQIDFIVELTAAGLMPF
jgi:hypothetical protein